MFRLCRLLFSFILFTIVATPVSATDKSGHNADAHQSGNGVAKKVQSLIEKAEVYRINAQNKEIDSVLDIAIEMATMSADDILLFNTYKSYFSIAGEDMKQKDVAQEYAANMLSLAKKHNNNAYYYYAYSAISKTHLQFGESKEALEKINKAYYYAALTDNDTIKIACFLQWGECLERTNNKIDAFKNYLNALQIAQKKHYDEGEYECYNSLSFFYLLIGNYERARDYKIKQFGLIEQHSLHLDSTKIMTLMSGLSATYYYNKERNKAEKLTNRIIDFAYRKKNEALLKSAFDNHKAYLMQNGLFKDLSDFYTVKYPNELKKLAIKDTISFYRIMSYVTEVKGQLDSATYYYQKAENYYLAKENKDNFYFSNFLKRYAQYLLRTGNTTLAKQKMEASFNAAKQAEYLPYLIETSAYLDSFNYVTGNMKKAYEFAKLHKQYADKQEEATRQDALLLLEIDNETRQREMLAKEEQEHTEHRHNVQYLGIVIAIISLFIVLVMMGSFKVPRVVIKSLGFFSFIFFFEFIILLADHKIMELTHHEPWKMLGIKIIIISILLPFHHWIEHKVIHYLIEHQLIDTSKLSPRRLFNKAKESNVEKKDTAH